jgi:hypothetical protein
MVSTDHSADMQRVSKKGKEKEPLCMTDYNHNIWGVNLRDQLLHLYMVEWGWPNGTSNFSKGHWNLLFSIQMLLADKS